MPHTKGPWHAAGRDNCEERGVPIFTANKTGLPYYIGWASWMGTADKGPALANARLMAAAPELLEALENLANFPYGHERTTCSDGEPYCDCGFGAAMERARELIAQIRDQV